MNDQKKQERKDKKVRRAWRALGRDVREALEKAIQEVNPITTRGIPPKVFFRPPQKPTAEEFEEYVRQKEEERNGGAIE